MTRRVLFVGLALAVVFGFGLAPAEAKGRCRAALARTVVCQSSGDGVVGDFALPDRRCRFEGRQCNQNGSECETLYASVECVEVDGGPSEVQVGMGCFCGGGSLGTGTDREDPISAPDFLRLLETLETEDTDPATCEAPPSLTPAPAE